MDFGGFFVDFGRFWVDFCDFWWILVDCGGPKAVDLVFLWFFCGFWWIWWFFDRFYRIFVILMDFN